MLALVALAGGCARELPSDYGHCRGSSSVNGTAVFANLLTQAGHKVRSWRWLSPRVQQNADVLVWAPDNFAPPSDKVRRWIEDWLLARPGRTAIYIGRDFDGASSYWTQVRQGTQGPQYKELSRQLADAQIDYNFRRSTATDADGEWFEVDIKPPHRQVSTLAGAPAWTAGVDPKQAKIEIGHRLKPPEFAEVLLASDGDALVTRQQWGDSQLLVLTNGSFLLNVALVNHEHRKLAQALIDQLGAPPKQVYFLDSRNRAELSILKVEPKDQRRDPSNPLNLIIAQLALLGALYTACRWPIFGRPRGAESQHLSDFGKHVEALGDLLERNANAERARGRLAHYRQMVHSDGATPGGASRGSGRRRLIK
ncbi:MAG: hypothetical protein K2Y37_24055 [Pirellulales bacterium]|nr:hypothetical protein [Pirellulales bacterium]